jgi:hypothetical protein
MGTGFAPGAAGLVPGVEGPAPGVVGLAASGAGFAELALGGAGFVASPPAVWAKATEQAKIGVKAAAQSNVAKATFFMGVRPASR